MKKENVFTLVVLLIIMVVIGLVVIWFIYKDSSEILDETTAIFTNQEGEAPYSDLQGNPVFLDKYLGKILVVVSWASWSPFSQSDLILLAELSTKYSSEEVLFLAINRKETKEQAQRYVNILPPLGGVVVALDPRDHFYAAVGGYAMPEAVIYNQKGELIEHFRGVTPKEDIIKTLDILTEL